MVCGGSGGTTTASALPPRAADVEALDALGAMAGAMCAAGLGAGMAGEGERGLVVEE